MQTTALNKPAGRVRRHIKDFPVIGWREWLGVPTLGIERIKAKIDTGARTSSLHAFDVRPFTERGAQHVAFSVSAVQRRRQPTIACVAPVYEQRMVTSSSGHRQLRYVIEVDIEMAGVIRPIELTLADRDSMGFRMLLGREAIRRRFLIDSDKSFIAGRISATVAKTMATKEVEL